MDARIIEDISKKVFLRFPEVKGSRPTVQDYSETHVLLIYKAVGKTADGHAIQRIVRVVAGKDGKISKMTTSR